MQLKTLSFNKTIFFKNIRRFWPIWAAYSFIMLWMMPLMFWFSSKPMFFNQEINHKLEFQKMLCGSCVDSAMFLGAVVPVICVMAVFSYMYKSSNVNFYHSLPITREGLFLTNYVSGLSFMLIPNVVTAILTLIVMTGSGAPCISQLLLWLLIITVVEWFYYSVACLIAMMTGQLVAVPIFFYVYMFYMSAINYPIGNMVSLFFYGSTESQMQLNGEGLLYPLQMFSNIREREVYSINDELVGYTIRSISVLAIAAIAIAVATVLALFLYKKRKSETAGDTIAFSWLKPVFRWGVAFSGMLCITNIAHYSFFSTSYSSKGDIYILIIVFVLSSGIGFFGAEMIMQKSFRVIKKKMKEWLIMAGLIAAVCILLLMDITGFEKKIPDTEDIEAIEVHGNVYGTFTDETNINAVRELHKRIIESREEDDELKKKYGFETDTQYIRLEYYLKNGDILERCYYIPYTQEMVNDTNANIYMYNSLINDNGIQFVFQNETNEANIINGSVTFYNDAYGKEVFLNRDEAVELFKAICRDLLAGNLTVNEAINSYAIDNRECYNIRLVLFYSDFESAKEKYGPDASEVMYSKEIDFCLGSYNIEEFLANCNVTKEQFAISSEIMNR